jgi:hypothetical protein
VPTVEPELPKGSGLPTGDETLKTDDVPSKPNP